MNIGSTRAYSNPSPTSKTPETDAMPSVEICNRCKVAEADGP